MALGSTRDQAFLNPTGSPPPNVAENVGHSSDLGHIALPYAMLMRASQPQRVNSQQFIGMNPEIAKSYVIHPTNQGQVAAVAQRQSMMYDPRNNPSRSQFQEGYTQPIQQFAAPQSYVGAEGAQVQSGMVIKQPSSKAVSPFSRLPIPTRMPWDL